MHATLLVDEWRTDISQNHLAWKLATIGCVQTNEMEPEETTATTQGKRSTEVWMTISAGVEARCGIDDGRSKRLDCTANIDVANSARGPSLGSSKATSYTNESFKTSARRRANSNHPKRRVSVLSFSRGRKLTTFRLLRVLLGCSLSLSS